MNKDALTTAMWIVTHSEGELFECTDWLNDDNGIGLRADEMTMEELLAAWKTIGCTFEYSKED
ncbi:MAG: hypothetical protein ACYS30_24645 [Planctomycetota bacterium]|jgi:hypothetical protein